MRVHMSRSAVAAFAAVTLAAAAASTGPAEAFPFFQPQPVTAGKPGKMSTAPNRSSLAPANKGASSAVKAQANVNTGQGVRLQRVWIVRPGIVVSKGGSSAGSGAQSASSGGGSSSSGGGGGGSSSFGDILKEKLGEVFKAKIDELLKLPSK
jgi:hypothetical protein